MTRNGSGLKHTLLTPEELASRWKGLVSIKTLRNWRSQGRGPMYLEQAGRRVAYLLSDVESFETQHHFRRQRPAKGNAR